MSAYPQKLVIFCPPTLATKYSAIADLFTPEGNLQLLVPTANYARINEEEGVKYYDHFQGSSVTLTPKRLGFSASITDQRFEIRLALEELADSVITGAYNVFNGLIIHDYCRVEWQDYAQGYTVRVGKIDSFADTSGGGTVKRGFIQCNGLSSPVEVPEGNQLYGGGFRFRFLEMGLRMTA